MSHSPRNSTRTTRVIRAAPAAIYGAFIDPSALVAWLPPAGMTARLHAFDARAGGGYEMSLYYPPEERRFRGKTAERRIGASHRRHDAATAARRSST
jgi:uncharacterized protein YndB with AHSA1/START domain